MAQSLRDLAIQQCDDLPFPHNIHLADIVCAVSLRDFSKLYIELGAIARYVPLLRRKLDDIAFTMINWKGRYVIHQVFFDILALPERTETEILALEIIVLSFITVKRNKRTMKTRRNLLPDDMSRIMSTLRA